MVNSFCSSCDMTLNTFQNVEEVTDLSECKKECDKRAWCISLDFNGNTEICSSADKIFKGSQMITLSEWTSCFVGKFIFATVGC